MCKSSGNDVDVAPSLLGASIHFLIAIASPPDLIQPPAMMGPHQCHSHSPYTLHSSVHLQGGLSLAQAMKTVSQVHRMFVEAGVHRMAVGEPSYPTLNSQPPLASVSCVPDYFAIVTLRTPSPTSLSFKRPSPEVVSFASPLSSPLDQSGWKGIRGFSYGGHGLPSGKDHNH